jgi:hypothetical protein
VGLVFVPFASVDRRQGPWDAIRSAWELGRGRRLTILGTCAAALVVYALTIGCLGVGMLIGRPIIAQMMAVAYVRLDRRP